MTQPHRTRTRPTTDTASDADSGEDNGMHDAETCRRIRKLERRISELEGQVEEHQRAPHYPIYYPYIPYQPYRPWYPTWYGNSWSTGITGSTPNSLTLAYSNATTTG